MDPFPAKLASERVKQEAFGRKPDALRAEVKKCGNDRVLPSLSDRSPSDAKNVCVTLSDDIALGKKSDNSISRSPCVDATEVVVGEAPNSIKRAALHNSSVTSSLEQTQPQQGRVTVIDTNVSDAMNPLGNRRVAEAAKQKLQEFFRPILLPQGNRDVKKLRSRPCVWLLSIALSCSYVSGERISVEDILCQNRLSLHYLSLPSVTLAELFDISNEFLVNHVKLKKMNIHCEVTTFDTETVDELGNVTDVGERLPITSLSQFRKELSNKNERSIYIMNFDPYLIEQHEIQMRLNDMELHETDVPKEEITPQWSVKNQGSFAIFLGFSSALHLVTLGIPFFLKNGNIEIEEHGVPIQVLYKALCVKDGYSNRSRGFVRIFFSDDFAQSVPSIFPLNVLDGSLSGGLLTTALDAAISPHILGLSLMHHLVNCTFPESTQQQQKKKTDGTTFCDAKLRGIPVTKLCQTLNLGVATIVGGSCRASVPTAFSWYKIFLSRLKMDTAVALGVVLPTRRGGAEDAPVNITEEVFVSHMELAVTTKSVMLFGFDVNVALNVKVDERLEPCHFAILIGLDRKRDIIRLADVNVKKYRKTWHVRVAQLHSAVIGYGYIVAAQSQNVIDKLNCKEFEKSILHEARYSLPPTKHLVRFEYPKKNYVVTIIADAFDRLGFTASVEAVMNLSGFHLSFMLSEHLPLESAVTVARNFSHYHSNDSFSILATHMDEGAAQSTRQSFCTQIRTALRSPKEYCLIVNFETSMLHANKAVWNGSNGGSYAIVLEFDEANSLVTLSDANHESFYRTWVCPLDVLFNMVSAIDPISLRARGTILLSVKSQRDSYVDCYGYDMSHALVHHPFKLSVWPGLHCLALIASEMTANNSSVNGGGIVSNRRAMQFSAEDFLYTMSSFSMPSMIIASKITSDHLASIANTTFGELQIPLKADVVDTSAAGCFLKACHDEMVKKRPVTMTVVGYDTQLVHGVPGFSAGVINRVRNSSGGLIQLVEGNGCAFGPVWEISAEKLSSAVTAMVRVRPK